MATPLMGPKPGSTPTMVPRKGTDGGDEQVGGRKATSKLVKDSRVCRSQQASEHKASRQYDVQPSIKQEEETDAHD